MGKNKLALIVLCTALFIIAVSDTVLNLALPSISGQLDASASQLLWIVDIYLIVVAALQIIFGSIGDRYGHKRTLQIGLVLFGFGSLGSAFSTSANMLIAFRAVTGLGAALMMPSTLSILTDVFREPKERSRAIAVWSSVFSIGAGLGPLIGGYLLEYFVWSSVFYLNIPIVVAGLIGAYLFLPESSDKSVPKPNIPSSLFSIGGLAALVYAIISAGELGWLNSNVLASFGVAALLLLGFVLWERRCVNPMFPLHFFKSMSFTGSTIAVTLSAFGLMGSLFFFSLYLQSVQGYSPFETGLCMLPMNMLILIITLISPRVDEKIGTKLTISLGLFIMGLGLLIFGLSVGLSTPYMVTLSVLLLLAIGLGLVMSPATNAIMNSIPKSRAGIGSAMNDTTRQIGGALGIAVLGSLINATYLTRIGASETINALPTQIGELIRNGLQSAQIAVTQLQSAIADQVLNFAKQAFLDGLTQSVFAGATIMFLAAIFTLIILPSKVQAFKEKSVHNTTERSKQADETRV